MKALVIYDAAGKIWSIINGEENAPQGLLCMFVDIPDGAVLNRIDVTNPSMPLAVYDYLPESDIGRLQEQCEESRQRLTDTQLALAEQYETNLLLQEETTNTQMALAEIYERKEA